MSWKEVNHKEEEKINMKRKKKKCVYGGRLCGKDPLTSVQTPVSLLRLVSSLLLSCISVKESTDEELCRVVVVRPQPPAPPLAQMEDVCAQLLLAATLWMMPHTGAVSAAVLLAGSTELLNVTGAGAQAGFRILTGAVSAPCTRQKRTLSDREINTLLDYHSRVRSQVFPPAANMELMVRKHCAVKWTNNNKGPKTSALL